MSWSNGPSKRKRTKRAVKADSINGHYTPTVPISHDHLDDLLEAMRMHKKLVGSLPGLWKADVDAAFRRLPIRESHKWAAGVAYLLDGEPWVAFHEGMPFGATSSVVAWHRIGALITAFARKLLHLPVFRYVDDWFAADRHLCACCSHLRLCSCVSLFRHDTTEHAMMCMARLVRVLLGETAISARKLECGPSLTVLGINVSVGYSMCMHVVLLLCSRSKHQTQASDSPFAGKRQINGC